MTLTAEKRRALRSLQLCLDSSLPTQLLESVERNDAEAWTALTMLEVRMLLARGQTYQARQFGDRLSTAAEAGLAVESFKGREYPLLINAVDSVQAFRPYLALWQLDQLGDSPTRIIQWAAQMWRSRAQASVGELDAARESCQRAAELAPGLAENAPPWTACFEAELQARAGEVQSAERTVLRALSHFVGQGETRGESFAYLALATVGRLAGKHEDSEAAAELAHKTDGSWTGPPLRLARLALQQGDDERALALLSSIPSPTTDAYNLKQALTAAPARQVPLHVLVRNLELAEAPPTELVIEELRRMIADHPRFPQARETLIWKLLYRRDTEEGERQLQAMVEDDADAQLIAAARFGLQTFREQITPLTETDLEELEAYEAPDERTPTGQPAGAMRSQRQPVADPDAAAAGQTEKAGGFTGQLSLFGVPDLIQFLCASRRTGLITLSSQRGDSKIRLHQGSLYWATSPAHPDILEFLVQQAAVPAAPPTAEGGVDEISRLVERDGVDPEKLATALRESLRSTVKEVADWTDGWFMFDRIADAATPRPELLFNAQGVLLDALRELDEERR